MNVRLSKQVRIGRARLTPRVDVYNLFNANGIQSQNTACGPSWLRPADIHTGRMVTVGAQFDF